MSNYVLEQDIDPIDKIGWVMDRILQSVEETFEGYGIELPELRYLTVGNPSQVPHDCEQVTVTNIQSYVGTPGDQAGLPSPCMGPRSGVFQVEVVRCFTDGSSKNLRRDKSTSPDMSVISEYTKSRMRDQWALLDASGFLPDYNGVIADVTVTDPNGEYQAVVLNLVVQI